MSKNLALLMLFFISACSPIIIREEPVPQATPESWVTQADIDYAENFAASIFTDEEWTGEISIHADRVMHTWNLNDTGNLAYLDYRIYTEGYTQEDLDYYYSIETFNNILFTHYDDLEQLRTCSTGNLTLYEFSASYMDTPYLIRDWVDTSNPKRIAELSLIFTEADRADFDSYARALFPTLPNCD